MRLYRKYSCSFILSLPKGEFSISERCEESIRHNYRYFISPPIGGSIQYDNLIVDLAYETAPVAQVIFSLFIIKIPTHFLRIT